jgi:hypothetical protein
LNDHTGYPWSPGDTLTALDLNAAIANATYLINPNNVINVTARGADPTGVGDSTAAFLAASTQQAADLVHYRPIYVPAGTYRVTALVPLSGVMFGDGRNSSVILIDDRFDNHGAATPASPGVFGLNSINPSTGHPGDTGAEVRDIGIRFVQPTTNCARANFKTLANGGTVATGVMYPPAFIVQSTARHKLIDVRVSCAWDGVSTAGKNCVLYLDNLEMCALNVGLGMGVGTAPGVGVGIKDVCHIKSYHFYAFDIINTHLADDLFNGVFWDGNTIAAQFGEIDGLEVGSFFSFVGRVIFVQDATWGAEKGAYYFNNLMLDTDATLEVNAANSLKINNFSANCEVKCPRALVKINPIPGVRARVQFNNWDMASGSGHVPLSISGAAADVTMTNGRLIPGNPAINAISLSDGILRMFGAKIRPSGAGIWSGTSSIGSLDAVPIAAGGNGAQVNDTFTDPNGGHYTATTVAAGVVTAIRMDKAPTIFGTAPSNPVALTGINNNTPSLASSTPVAGGAGYLFGDGLKDSYGNRYTVTSVGGTSGTAITTISLTTPAVWFANFPPANPVALIDAAGGGIGAGATVNLNWVNHVTTAAGVNVNLDWAARVSNVSSMPSSTPVAGGGGNLVGDRLTDIYGNRYTVQAIDGFGGVTSLSLDTARVFVGATPSNPVALTAELPGVGIGVTVNLTWTTSPAGATLIAQGGTGVLQLDDIDIGGNVNGKDNDTSSGVAIAINTDMPGMMIGKVTLGDNWSWRSVAHSAQPGSQIDWLPTVNSYPDDASASAAGIGIGQFYRNGNVMLIRSGSAAGSPIALPATTVPIVEGIAAPGTLLAYARADHIHPAAAPPFVPAAATITPIVEGVGNAGTLLTYARGDHVHPASGSAAWVPAGQPDGTTDNTAALQAAITAAAGHGAITVPGAASNYIVGHVTLLSNTHLIIETGATLFLKNNTNTDMFDIGANTNNLLIELYGTIDGNASGQTGAGLGGGIGVTTNMPCSNIYIRGDDQGVITNCKNWPINIASCTNGEVSGLTMSNSGNSPGFAGISRNVATIAASGSSYDTSTGIVVLMTTAAHGIAVGGEFYAANVTGTGSYINVGGTRFATAVTSTTLTFVIAAGLGAGTITGGTIKTCTKSYNVGLTNCIVSNINDLSICLYGGVVNGWIRGCRTSGGASTGPSMLSDAGQPGQNVNCEISGCVAHGHLSQPGITVSSNTTGCLALNARVFNNLAYGNKGGALITADGLDFFGNRLVNNLLSGPMSNGLSGELIIPAPAVRIRVFGNTIRDPQLGATTGYGIAVNNVQTCHISENFIGDYQLTPTMRAAIGGSFLGASLVRDNFYGPCIGPNPDVATYSANSFQDASAYMLSGAANAPALIGGVFADGRNLLHNPLFNVQQRGVGPWTTNNALTADRWMLTIGFDVDSISLVALVDADRDVIGQQAVTCLQNVFTGNVDPNAVSFILQRIEGVRRLAGKNVVVSFWAKATSGTPKLGVSFDQRFGTGGSPSGIVAGLGLASPALSTAWQFISLSFAIPGVDGKILGTNNDDNTAVNIFYSGGTNFANRVGSIGVQSGTVQIWGVQVELSAVTPLEIPHPQTDLNNCRRFYQTFAAWVPVTTAPATLVLPVPMRATPAVSGGGAGFVTTGATASAAAITVGQTAGAAQTLTFTADL